MPCLLVVLVMMFPRLVMLVIWLVSNYLERAYHGLLIPLLGFIFLPVTALTYAWLVNTNRPVDIVYIVVLVLALVIDTGSHKGGVDQYRNR